jgi:hypothetical protein
MTISPEPDDVARIRNCLRSDLTTAIKYRDQLWVRVLRSAIASIDNAEAVQAPASADGTVGYADVPRLSLDRAQLLHVFEAEVGERQEAIATYESVGQREEAATLRLEIDLLRGYAADI